MLCAICGEKNDCEIKNGTNCWCEYVDIPRALLAKVPVNKRGKWCICQKCVDNSKNLA